MLRSTFHLCLARQMQSFSGTHFSIKKTLIQKKKTSNSNKLFYLDNSITKRFYSIAVHFSDFHLLVVVERKITDNMDDIIINYLFDTARCLVTVYKFTYN